MITIAEVIEQCARVAIKAGDTAADMYGVGAECITTAELAAEAIRALAAKYEGCIVAEGKPVLFAVSWQSQDQSSLYRAKEPTK